MKIFLDKIGNTPIINIEGIWAKLEIFNPSGSIKDRIAKYMIEKAIERGELKPGYTIIEVTSGNTGISFAMLSAILGFKFIAVMSKDIKSTKPKIIELLGGKCVLIPENTREAAMKKVKELAKKYKKVWLPMQFENLDNVECHYKTTGKEILNQVKRIDAFVAGIGTGGTLVGVAKALKEKNPNTKIFGVRPAEIPNKIEGLIGKNETMQKIIDLNKSLIDEVIEIKNRDAIKTTKYLNKKYGLMVGISSGANFLAAKIIKKKYKFESVVTVFPDRLERYVDILSKNK
ncbi:MAG: cysteine synthase family protein [Candidatus Aenigmatarchaeota archaeon]